jgi:hypothetical protein
MIPCSGPCLQGLFLTTGASRAAACLASAAAASDPEDEDVDLTIAGELGRLLVDGSHFHYLIFSRK